MTISFSTWAIALCALCLGLCIGWLARMFIVETDSNDDDPFSKPPPTNHHE